MDLQPIQEVDEDEKLEKVSIQLGDIITILAPTDQLLNNRTFFVKYLDKTKLELVEQDGNETAISFDTTGKLDNESITGIEILSRADSASYAIQNNLMPGTWIDVYFGGDVPVIFTGKITNLEEDMIEITTYPENDVIFIDFGYKGIPPELPIEKIVIREAPAGKIGEIPEPSVLPVVVAEGAEGLEAEGLALPEAEFEEELIEEEEVSPIDLRAQLRELILTADQIKIGTELESITQEVDVPESEQRFGIEKQTNDLLDELLSTVPNSQRTESVLNGIHKMIERFQQLRAEFSIFDIHGNALLPATQGADYKPLVESLQNFSQKLYWILPVVKNKKKIYDVDDTGEDVEALTLAESRLGEQAVMDRYNSSNFPKDENRYAFLINGMNPYLTPFTEPARDVDGIIIKTPVNTNILAIVDNVTNNLKSFYSSVASGGNEKTQSSIKQRRFVIEQYNLGMNMLDMNKVKGGNMIVKRKQITENDTLALTSMVMLPEVTVRFSRVTMPSTNVLIKSNLNIKYLNYWQLLKNNTSVSTTLVDDLDKPVDYDVEKFLEGIKQFEFAAPTTTITSGIAAPPPTARAAVGIATIAAPPTASGIAAIAYKKYLEAIVPKTRILFDLVKPYIKGKLSIYNVLSYLEPFMIYQRDLSFKQYETINEFISEKIVDFKRRYFANAKEFSTLTNRGAYDYVPNLVRLFEARQELRETVLLAYGIDISLVNVSDSEFLKKINDVDTGILYNNAVSLMVSSLLGSGNSLEEVVLLKTKYEKNKVAINDAASTTNNPCASYKVIAKHYIEFDELEEDNSKKTYFDKKYDTTYYDILKEYKFDSTMPTEERIAILTKKLAEKNGLREKEARREAEAMVNGFREVKDGDYAIFESKSPDGEINFSYFIRINDKWQEDESIPRDLMTDSSKMFCNLNEKCIQVKGDCYSIDGEASEAALKNTNLKQMIDEVDPSNEFYSNLEETLNNKRDQIKEEFDNAEFRIGKITTSKIVQLLKYEDQKFRIGATAADIITEVSPYASMRDRIFGQGDFIKRQMDIVKFVRMFTRQAVVKSYVNTESPGPEEDSYWYYCTKTNTKLVPTFLVEIADAVVRNENFSKVIERICAEQGTISDDGNKWVDKHSGYTIRSIDLSTEEDYTEEGFKVKTRAVMEVDLGDTLFQQEKAQKKAEDTEDAKQTVIINNIVTTMARNTTIMIDEQKEFIIRNVLIQQGRVMPSKTDYNKSLAAAAAKGKKNLDDYETASNKSLLLLTLCYFLIAVQISVPPVKSRKTFPGCILPQRNFERGYPLGAMQQSELDLTAITYIACVANKTKNKIKPWNAIQKMKPTDIVSSMKTIIDKFILPTEEVKEGIKVKLDYLNLNPHLKFNPAAEDNIKWLTFLPPLQPVKLSATALQNVTEGFQKEFIAVLRKGSPKQHEMLNIIRSKIITFSLGIIEAIQKTVTKKVGKVAILTSSSMEPFLENACCDDGDINTLRYFIKAEPDIVTYNATVVKLANIIDDITQTQKAGLFYATADTKYKFPSISEEFSEEVIYKAFIVFCNYGNAMPISEELKAVCMNKPDRFNANDSLSESIRILKRDGKNYSVESLDQLLKVVNTNNTIKMNLNKQVVSNIDALRDLLGSMKLRNVDNPLKKEFIDKFLAILVNFEKGSLFADTPEMRAFKNMLAKANEAMLIDIKDLVKRVPSIDAAAIDKFNTCVEHITDFEQEAGQKSGDGVFIEREDETLYKMIGFIKNSLRSLTREFPNIIINQVDYADVTIPAYWKLSQKHNSDLSKDINTHYSLLSNYYGDSDIKMVMRKTKQMTRDMEQLAQNTLFFAPIQLAPSEYMYSVFDRRLTMLLFKFYFYNVLTDIISLKNDDEILLKTVLNELEDVDDENELLSTDARFERQNGTAGLMEMEIIQGNKKELAEKIANIVVTFATILCKDKAVIDYSYKSLMDSVLREKDKEKEGIKLIFNALLDNHELRELENTFKNLKLGDWSKGLNKSIFAYDKDTYDEERDAMDKQATTDMALATNAAVTDMNRDIYRLDAAQDEVDTNDMDKEATTINYLGEDAEYEDDDMDGDEQY